MSMSSTRKISKLSFNNHFTHLKEIDKFQISFKKNNKQFQLFVSKRFFFNCYYQI